MSSEEEEEGEDKVVVVAGKPTGGVVVASELSGGDPVPVEAGDLVSESEVDAGVGDSVGEVASVLSPMEVAVGSGSLLVGPEVDSMEDASAASVVEVKAASLEVGVVSGVEVGSELEPLPSSGAEVEVGVRVTVEVVAPPSPEQISSLSQQPYSPLSPGVQYWVAGHPPFKSGQQVEPSAIQPSPHGSRLFSRHVLSPIST